MRSQGLKDSESWIFFWDYIQSQGTHQIFKPYALTIFLAMIRRELCDVWCDFVWFWWRQQQTTTQLGSNENEACRAAVKKCNFLFHSLIVLPIYHGNRSFIKSLGTVNLQSKITTCYAIQSSKSLFVLCQKTNNIGRVNNINARSWAAAADETKGLKRGFLWRSAVSMQTREDRIQAFFQASKTLLNFPMKYK